MAEYLFHRGWDIFHYRNDGDYRILSAALYYYLYTDRARSTSLAGRVIRAYIFVYRHFQDERVRPEAERGRVPDRWWGAEEALFFGGRPISLPSLASPPVVNRVKVVGNNKIRIVFNLPVEKSSVEEENNYQLTTGTISEAKAIPYDSEIPWLYEVELTTSPLSSGGHKLILSNIKDGIKGEKTIPNGSEIQFTYGERGGIEKAKQEVEGKRLTYPNPFNPECYIPVNIKCQMQNAKCKIYNILGQLVREIECSGVQEFKGARVYWDGRDSRGLEVPAGVYFYEIAGEEVKRIVVLR
jgi:hypothetical protein